MVLKPATETPLTAIHIVDILERAGLPKGVLNLVIPEKTGPAISKMSLGTPFRSWLKNAMGFLPDLLDSTAMSMRLLAPFEPAATAALPTAATTTPHHT
jgi:hypothetical protein